MQQFHSQALGTTLDTALQQLISRFQRDSGITVQLDNGWPEQELSEREALQVHRIIEEALANAWHHGHAHTIRLLLDSDEYALQLLIEDDGEGFAAGVRPDAAVLNAVTRGTGTREGTREGTRGGTQGTGGTRGTGTQDAPRDARIRSTGGPTPTRGYGLPGMRERARQLEALLSIDSEPGQGTRIYLYLPRGRKPAWEG
ncbi:sensor histidine kinase [Halorhodospira abdelmalekii]|uniref:sensor histidine kinase n=1 Tax=Halorhodospira abdelmalekii TaxID=421629 RepID=UPI00190611DF|nr:ATP-binding protein [Halorhodospira abdelmalekii]